MAHTPIDNPDAFLQELVDSPRTIFWMTDPQQNCLYLFQNGTATPAQRRAFSFVTWLKHVHPDDLLHLVPIVKRVREALEGYKVRYRLIRSDGSIRSVLGIAEPRFDSRGRFVGYIGTVSDTGEHAPGQALFTSSPAEEVHRLVAETSSDLISHFAPDTGNYIYISPSVKSVAGYEPEELVGRSAYDMIHPDDIERVRDELRRQLRGEAPDLVEHRVRTRSGDWLWFTSNVSIVWNREHTDMLGAVVVSRNTHRERMALDELKRSEERFRSLTALSSDWYWETDADGRLTFLSDGLYRLFGATPDIMLGRTRTEIAAGTEQPGLQEYQRRVARREPFRDLVYAIRVQPHGTIRHAAISGQPVFEDGVFTGYRGVGRDITREIEFSAKLEHLARHDVLTGLPNRLALVDSLRTLLAAADGTPVAVLFIDLDRFKEVNDSLGHAAGDHLLVEVAQRFARTVRGSDVVARLGGDEFVVCAPCPGGHEEAAALGAALLAALDAPVEVAGEDVWVRASIGACLAPADGDNEDVLFQNADIAMYQAKAEGRNRFRFFESEMSARAKARMAFETSMRRALEQGEFELHYQPRLDLRTMQVTGMEALIRWNHPQLGRVSPLEFIPFAEERGFIGAIGAWVLEEACRQTQSLNQRHGLGLQVSVNLSARQLASHALLEQVSFALASAGLPPALLELELTETALVEDIAVSTEILKKLKALGVSLAVDDFGTGYSGLAYLGRFPLDTLKLDRSFVNQDEPRSNDVIRAFIDMAHALKLSVVAEGVERADTLAFLHAVRCDEAQGYLIARPMALAQFEEYLLQQAAPRVAGLD